MNARTPLGTLSGLLIALAALESAAADPPSGRTLAPADFVSESRAAVEPVPERGADIERITPAEARGDVLSVGVVPGAPGLDPTPAHTRVVEIYDAKVGEISGRPIFLNSFLEPLEAQLEAEGRRLTRDQWSARARRAVEDRLRGMVFDELLSDEGLSLLTPAQRSRLDSIGEVWRARLLSQNAGSEQLASERLAAEREMTIEEYLREQKRLLLIQYVIENEVRSKVVVTLDDIRRFYQANHARFNPPPVVVFRQIDVPTADADAVARVAGALESGGRFAEVASTADNRHARATGGLIEAELSGPFETSPVHADEAIDRALHTLAPGAHAGPFVGPTTTAWVMLEEVRSTGVSLEDAQLFIAEEIRAARTNEAQQRFVLRLMERAGFTTRDFDRMRDEILRAAEARYAPEA